jgi:hypothetical protein
MSLLVLEAHDSRSFMLYQHSSMFTCRHIFHPEVSLNITTFLNGCTVKEKSRWYFYVVILTQSSHLSALAPICAIGSNLDINKPLDTILDYLA